MDRILVVDPVPSSRLALAEALTCPGRVVATARGIDDALRSIRQARPALVFVCRDLEEGAGLEFLQQLQQRQPEIQRVLVTDRGDATYVRRAIARADLAFVLRGPWHLESLRQTVHDILAGDRRRRDSWRAVPSEGDQPRLRRTIPTEAQSSARKIESLSRGLLAGLNSCEREIEIFRLLHAEIASACPVRRWLWVGERPARATRIIGLPPTEVDVDAALLDSEERGLLERLRGPLEGVHLARVGMGGPEDGEVMIGLTLFIRSYGRLRGLVWANGRDASFMLRLLEKLQPGLRNACHRVRAAESRALAARLLARRVSEDLRTPVGALAHAVDRLRCEAERAGYPSEWLERVSSESRRVVEAVDHFEGKLFVEATHAPPR